MEKYAFKCVVLLNNNIRIVAENLNTFERWAWELATFEVPRYPTVNVYVIFEHPSYDKGFSIIGYIETPCYDRSMVSFGSWSQNPISFSLKWTYGHP